MELEYSGNPGNRMARMFEWYLLEQIPRVPQPPEYERSLALRNRPERENQQRDLEHMTKIFVPKQKTES